MATKNTKKTEGKAAGAKDGIPKNQPGKAKRKLLLDKHATMTKIALRDEKPGTSISLKQIRSGAGRSEKQNATLVGLGLRNIGRVSTLQDTPAVRGMIAKVAHLVEVTDSK